MRGLPYYIFLYLKGICIGATGVLHGVSGGSMALLLGVHDKFVFSLRELDREAFSLIGKNQLARFWKKVHGDFLLILITGIVSGIFLLRPRFSAYYADYPIFVSSFFFSLVIIAALLLLRKINRWNGGVFLALAAGLIASYALTVAPPLAAPENPLFAFVIGAFSGLTFVLPGVSGAFILVFSGKYQYILASFGSLEIEVIILFIAGSILGITVSARFIANMLKHYLNATVALFAGLMIGSLNKIWPWRQVVEYAVTAHGKRIPAFDISILPWRYLETTGKDPQVFYAILMMALGVLLVVIIEKIAVRLKTRS